MDTDFAIIHQFIQKVKSGKQCDSFHVAEMTVELFVNVITKSEWKNAKELLALVKMCGKILMQELPFQTSAENIVRRILKIIRDEYSTACYKNKFQQEELDLQESLHKMVTSGEDADDYSSTVTELMNSILDHISEFQTELETSHENIAKEAVKHIHESEIILTIGKSAIVEAFLKEAAKSRKFEVFVCECSPENSGHEMAINLSKHKIQTRIIPDSVMFGIMSRVNKVIIGTQAVLANGGLRAICGTYTVALAAKRYSVPVLVLSGLYKLSPHYLTSHEDRFNQLRSPQATLDYADGVVATQVVVYSPMFDYVPPELVTLFISNVGGHAPSYVYRLLSELYHSDDRDL